ncbi:glycosyltransferase family A protein [Pseudarthrobacter oxydans]
MFDHLMHRLGRAAALRLAQARLALPTALQRPSHTNPNVVVSLTTFPARIGHVSATLESIYRQNTAPAHVVLVLSKEEFVNQELPQEIEAFRDRGLRVLFEPGNARSYKKLIPALNLFPDKVIVTADDDVIYPRLWLEELVRAHEERPHHVLGHRGTLIVSRGGRVEPYLTWPRALRDSPSSKVFLTGMGGILYPPGSLPDQVSDMNLAMTLCPTADDIWFKAMALLAGTPTAKISDASGDFPSLPSGRISALNQLNVGELRNDTQFTAVMKHFDLWDKLSL